MTPEEWLTREDEASHADRLARLKWLSEMTPRAEYRTFPGGLLALYSFEEARYSFVYGQFLAAIILGIVYIENTLAAQFYATGRNDLKRAKLEALLKEALNYGWIDQREYINLDHARQIRNSVTHFREPLKNDTVEFRAVMENDLPYAIIEEDARQVIETAMRLLLRNAI